MTHDEIDRLPAGPELDKLVAIQLGYTLIEKTAFSEARWQDGDREVGFVSRMGCTGEDIFAPSSDWTSAMWAAEKIGRRGANFHPLGVKLNLCVNLIDMTCEASLEIHEDDLVLWASAPTGPLAIARAIAKLGVKP